MNRPQPRILLLLVLVSGLYLICRSTHAAPSNTADAFIEPSEADNFYEARSRLWIAAGTSKLRGVLVLLSGTDCDARGKVSDPFWQSLARREQFALLGVYFRGEGEHYESAAGGSGTALLRMIDQVAATAGRPYLADAPLLLVGHSAGAMFAYNFAGWAPLRTSAFVAVKAGPIRANPDPRFAAVPGLFIVGEHDMDSRVQTAAAAFAGGSRPASWALAVEPGAGHEWTSEDNDLIDTYLHELLSQSAQLDNRLEHAHKLVFAKGCLRNLSDPSVANPSPLASKDAVWLPDAASANAWERFTKPARVAELLTQATATKVLGLTIEPATLHLEESSNASPVPDEITGSVLVRVDHVSMSDCTFNTSDPRLIITAVPLETNCYRLEARLRTTNLAAGLYRSRVNVVARDQKNERCEFPVFLLVQVKSAVKLTPDSLYVGVLDRGEICERTVKIPQTGTGAIWKIRSIQSSNPQFATVVPTAARIDGTLLTCRFDAKTMLGNQSGYFELVLENGQSSIHTKLPFIAFVSKRSNQSKNDPIHNVLQ